MKVFRDQEVGMPEISLEQARAARETALRRFEKLGAVGITRVHGEYALKLNLRVPVGPGVDLPADIDGVPLCVEVTGPIRPRSAGPRGEVGDAAETKPIRGGAAGSNGTAEDTP